MIVLSLPLVGTVRAQLYDMLPMVDELMPDAAQEAKRRGYQAITDAVERQQEIIVVRDACRHAASGVEVDTAPYRQADARNGLYLYIDILSRLRNVPGEGSPDPNMRDLLHRVRRASPARLYLSRRWRLAYETFERNGMAPRRAAAHATYLTGGSDAFHVPYRPVFRELTNRLLDAAERWSEAGHVEDARLARAAVIRLLTDAMTDSPTPEVVLLVVERLPEAIRGAGRDDTLSAAEADAIAARIERFHADWHDSVSGDQASLLPRIDGAVLARADHDRALRSLTSSALSMLTWGTLFCAAVVVLPFAMAAVPASAPGSSRSPSRGRSEKGRSVGRGKGARSERVREGMIAPAPLDDAGCRWRGSRWRTGMSWLVVLLPLVVTLVYLATADVPFTWLISLPSAWGLACLPALTLVAMIPAVRIGVAGADAPSAVARRAAWVAVLIVLLTLVAGSLIAPVAREPWQPPALVQRLRLLGPILALVSGVVVAIWAVWAAVHLRRRPGASIRSAALGVLAVVSYAALAAAIVSFACLAISQRFDRIHGDAFARGMADPIADRLGDDWHERYFGGVQDVRAQLNLGR